MTKLGGGGLLVAGILLVILGAITQAFIADLIEAIVRVLGYVFIGAGVILGIIGIVKMFSGDRSASGDF